MFSRFLFDAFMQKDLRKICFFWIGGFARHCEVETVRNWRQDV